MDDECRLWCPPRSARGVPLSTLPGGGNGNGAPQNGQQGGGGWVPPVPIQTHSKYFPPVPSPVITRARRRFENQLLADMRYFGLAALPPDQPVCNCPANEQCGQQCGPFGHLCKWTCSGGDSGWSWKKIGKRI